MIFLNLMMLNELKTRSKKTIKSLMQIMKESLVIHL